MSRRGRVSVRGETLCALNAGVGVHAHTPLEESLLSASTRGTSRWVSQPGGSWRVSVFSETPGFAAVLLFGGTPHREDAIHGEEVVFRQVSAVEESGGFQEESLAL